MRVLALETSQRQASLAALHGQEPNEPLADAKVLHTSTLPPQKRTAQALLPAVRAVLAKCNWRPTELDLVCVSTGPGSFTGLRIGVTTAKTLAYATGAHLVGVHTLAVIAARAKGYSGRLWTLLDAQRQELFAACFPVEGRINTEVLHSDAWLEQLRPGDTVSGPPLRKLVDRLPPEITATAMETWSPRAIEVGQLGVAAFCRGEVVDPMQLVPRYFRRSAAEEKADG
ncbi:MAG: tRNA (adenosine(37)-N6)-threonylcarbamoyltransferase complex dimerization subunit type 1 TsaB [Pirellulales bacterium]|nr:tRNA (adenosine(37)-N6)-threonylcarbamoyltransferase complex dimerization subunit type 1 TsaB [Pirellulales bacterium]